MKTNYKTEFIVNEPSLLLNYLFLNVEHKSKNNIKSLLTRGNVSVDGKVITKYNYALRPGQKVVIGASKIEDKHYKQPLNIIYEDNEIIVINKPEGLLSIANDDEKEVTAYHMVADYIKQNNKNNRIFIVHRLDRDTSGILLFAKNENIKHLLQDNWEKLVSIRGYVAVVEGKVTKEKDTIKSWLKETPNQMIYSSHKVGDGKEAITHYQLLKANGNYSLLNITIDTGRKNQIRVHMNDIGHSVVGDKKYYAESNPLKRLGLHAHILELKHPITNKIMHFETPIPNEFKKLF